MTPDQTQRITPTPDELIDGIIVNRFNFEHMAMTGKINGSLRADLLQMFTILLEQNAALKEQLSAKDLEIAELQAESNGKDEYLRKVMENVGLRRKEIEGLESDLTALKEEHRKDWNQFEKTNKTFITKYSALKQCAERMAYVLEHYPIDSTAKDLVTEALTEYRQLTTEEKK